MRTGIQVKNYPNPFNPATTFSYRVPDGKAQKVNLEVYNLRGQRVATLVDQVQAPGDHQVRWNGLNSRGEKISSGVYLYKLSVDKETVVQKMTLLNR
ncbi:MAG: hypothetical protein A2Z06_02200 [Candidatus Glassbacteria bacterium RBG_16_58_8]|uniref:FlgD/Vpr Ig-like domain-containing protein n=1 Tax=Candidatus Glassbacteria bacterium RBG_16_58_8 TaxID=1817866 RepID=A0A1F5YC63_9BACT|nr:MAG: hypothetical protein A2Z06_02200 [Candidatus Glassbacteria bacterium RBG_16_58_8]